MIENEAKFRLKDKDLFQRNLRRLGAVPGSLEKERDFVCDTSDNLFSRQGKLIRLRALSRGCLLTFKGAVLPGRFKKRYEANFLIRASRSKGPGNVRKAGAVLDSLGLKKRFAKEKIRRQWKYKKTVVCVDTLPCLGDFAEIEGTSTAIRAAARDLGLDPRAAIKESYEALFSRFCLKAGRKSPAAFRKANFSFGFEKDLKKKGLL